MVVAIVKYNAGNTRSVQYALERLGITPLLTDNAEELQAADRVIFPGVGEAATAMKYLKERNLDTLIPTLRQPVLGICLGLQLLCRHSAERDTKCMGVFDTEVLRFEAAPDRKVPHMGWNTIQSRLEWLKPLHDEYFYFVHSYYAPLSEYTAAACQYAGTGFSAALQHRNFYAAQFHPEKSSDAGSKLLEDFILRKP